MKLSTIIRRFLEKLTRRWSYRRRLPTHVGGGLIYVTPAVGLKYLFRSMAKVDAVLIRNVVELIRPNDIVWDIGANVGLFAFAAAARAGRNGAIFAFEPDTWLVDLLRKSAAIQPATSAPISVVPVGVASDVSLRSFGIAARSRASNAICSYGHTQMGGIEETQTIMAVNLDWLADRLPAPDVIKCDVEGAEIEVFSGQLKVLRHIRPVILCEVGGGAAEAMTQILRHEGYVLYDGEKPLVGGAEVDRACWNTIAIPKELRQLFIQNDCRKPSKMAGLLT